MPCLEQGTWICVSLLHFLQAPGSGRRRQGWWGFCAGVWKPLTVCVWGQMGRAENSLQAPTGSGTGCWVLLWSRISLDFLCFLLSLPLRGFLNPREIWTHQGPKPLSKNGRDESKASGSWGRAGAMERERLPANTLIDSVLSLFLGNVTGTTDGQSSTVKTTTQSVASIIASDQTLNSTPDKQSAALTSTETSTVTTAPASTVVSTSAQQSPTASATETTPVTTGAPAATSTTVSTSPESTSSRNAMNDSPTSRIPTTHSVATDSVAAKEGSQKIATSPHPNIIPSISPVLSSSTNLSSTQQPSPGPVTLAPGTSEPTGSFPEGSDKMTVTTSLGRMTSPTFTAQVTTLSKCCLAFLK